MIIDSEIRIEAGQSGQPHIEGAAGRKLLRTRFRHASILEMDHLFVGILDQIQAGSQNLSTFDFYKKIADAIPGRIPDEAQQVALQAAASIDPDVSTIGKKILLYLNLKSVFSAIDELVEGRSADEADEIVQAGIIGVLKRLSNLSPMLKVAQQVYMAARYGAALQVAATEGVMVGRVLDGSDKEKVNRIITVDMNEKSINGQRYLPGEDIDFEAIIRNFLAKDIQKAISVLSPRERKIIELRHGLDVAFDKPLTHDEIGKMFSVTSERIRQLEERALRKLRHPVMSKIFVSYWGGMGVSRRSILHDNGLVPSRIVVNPAAEPEVPTAKEEKETWLRKMRYFLKHIKVDGPWLKWVSEHPLPEGATIDDDLERYREYMKAHGEKT